MMMRKKRMSRTEEEKKTRFFFDDRRAGRAMSPVIVTVKNPGARLALLALQPRFTYRDP